MVIGAAVNNIEEIIKLDALYERSRLDSVEDFKSILSSTLTEIVKRIVSNETTDWQRKRLRKFVAEITQLIKDDYGQLFDLIVEDQQEWAKLAYETNGAALAASTAAVSTSFEKLPESAIKRILDPGNTVLGFTLKEHVAMLGEANERQVRAVLTEGLAIGRPTPEITRQITEIYGGLERHKVESMARTFISGTMHNAYEEAVFQMDEDVAETAYYSAVLDARTTPYCMSMAGTVWRRKKGETMAEFKQRVYQPRNGRSPKTPAHWNCRSNLVFTTNTAVNEFKKMESNMVFHEMKEDKKTGRFAPHVVKHRDGTTSTKWKVDKVEKIAPNLKFTDAFDQFADEKWKKFYLGEEKYKLYKEKGLKIKDIVDLKKNKVFTVKQIREKFGG